MNVFVTGATGFIGVSLCHSLAEQGYTVHALVRNPSKAAYLRHGKIRPVPGHILDPQSLEKGMASCEVVFHLAALAKVWSPDPEEFYNVNVKGTVNVLNAALSAGVRRVVITSTAGVYGPSVDGQPVNEQSSARTGYFTEYERTKALADREALRFLDKGLEVFFLHPTRVYGPGQLNESNTVTRMISQYIRGQWHLLPGNGKSIGNYVFIEDVIKAHILALEHGKSGEHYLLGGDNVSYNDFFRIVRQLSGKSYTLYPIPYILMISASAIMEFLSLFGMAPLITRGYVRKYSYDWIIDSGKAMRDLGYDPISLEAGVKQCLKWIGASEEKGGSQFVNIHTIERND